MQPTEIHSPSQSAATDATQNCMAGREETFAYEATYTAVTSSPK
jgi:hypothetical protein